MLEILSIKPPNPTVVALKQTKAKFSRSKKQKDSERASTTDAVTEAQEHKTELPKQKLLLGNGLHSWRPRLVVQVIAINEENGDIQFRLQDGLEIWIKRHYRIDKKHWREVSIGS